MALQARAAVWATTSGHDNNSGGGGSKQRVDVVRPAVTNVHWRVPQLLCAAIRKAGPALRIRWGATAYAMSAAGSCWCSTAVWVMQWLAGGNNNSSGSLVSLLMTQGGSKTPK